MYIHSITVFKVTPHNDCSIQQFLFEDFATSINGGSTVYILHAALMLFIKRIFKTSLHKLPRQYA